MFYDEQKKKDNLREDFISSMAKVFELLAKFDYEDIKRVKKSVADTGLLVSAPRRSISGSDK